MSRRLAPLALLLAAALGVAGWSTRGGRGVGIGRADGPAVIRVGAGGDPELAEPPEGVDPAEVSPADPAPPTRVSASPEPSGEESGAPTPDVAGVLTTFEGRPVDGARVSLTWEEEPETARALFGRERHLRRARTDARGTFLFEGVPRTVRRGRFVYGEEYLLGSPVDHPVDPEADWQILRLPELPPQEALARIDVVTEEGRPLDVEVVELEFRGPTPSVRARRPTAADREIGPGRVTLYSLVPGKWVAWVAADGGGEGGLEFEIRRPGEVASLTLVLPWFEGAADTTIAAAAPTEGKLWIDPTSGIHDWLPEDTLTLGEADSDRHFAHTLRLGHGPVSAATLTIRMRSINGMSTNDAIYLEHVGEREFRWRSRIAALVPGDWRGGDRTTLRLDLQALPSPEGDVNLLPHLEDGLLDVIVQDDTAIDAVSLRVVR